jgi:hypothetical protein
VHIPLAVVDEQELVQGRLAHQYGQLWEEDSQGWRGGRMDGDRGGRGRVMGVPQT